MRAYLKVCSFGVAESVLSQVRLQGRCMSYGVDARTGAHGARTHAPSYDVYSIHTQEPPLHSTCLVTP